jgi:uncharacterized iron-regulated membrane protein
MRHSARRFHRLIALGIALPTLLVLVTGILLQLRQDWRWIQPRAELAQPGMPVITIQQALEQVRAVPEAGVRSWEDVATFDVRFRKGTISVRTRNGYEVQLDGRDGKVLSAAPRRTSLLIELHQGSFFHPLVMRWVFLPAGIGLLFLWFSGVWIWAKRRPRRE